MDVEKIQSLSILALVTQIAVTIALIALVAQGFNITNSIIGLHVIGSIITIGFSVYAYYYKS